MTRSIHEGARDLARDIAETDAFVASRRARRKVEMLFAHMKKIMGLNRLRLRGPNGAKDEFTLAATAQNLRKMGQAAPGTGVKGLIKSRICGPLLRRNLLLFHRIRAKLTS